VESGEQAKRLCEEGVDGFVTGNIPGVKAALSGRLKED
jgi:hypothetical protein